MNRSILGRAAFAAAVALALGFGVREAGASSATQARPFCSDHDDCQSTCERLYPGYDGFGFCSSGHTCYC